MHIVNEDGSIGTFLFSNPIIAFAIDITFSSSVGLTIGGDVSQTISMTAITPKFWGVIDPDGITDVTFDAAGGFYCIYFDSLSYVLPSEQPSSIPSEAPSVSGVPSTEVSNYPTYCDVHIHTKDVIHISRISPSITSNKTSHHYYSFTAKHLCSTQH